MLELERTFLLKSIPPGLLESQYEGMVDTYIPADAQHPVLRLRKKGKRLELTKKKPEHSGDSSEQTEETIRLNQAEYAALQKLQGKRVAKRRYAYKGAEVDIFTEKLSGLALVDFEFTNREEKESFEPPDYCLVEVTTLEVMAGGFLAGKSFEEVFPQLQPFGYSPVKLSSLF